MVGRPIDQVFPKRDIAIGETVLEVEGLSNATEFADITFNLRRGEILGFYGLVGAGRSEAAAMSVRHEPADARDRAAERPADRRAFAGRRDRALAFPTCPRIARSRAHSCR